MPKFALGQSVSRLEDDRLLKGAGCYTDDFPVSGALHAVLLRSPHAHAFIKSISIKNAVESKGIVAIFTGKDVEADGLGDVPCVIPVVNLDGTNRKETPRPVLAKDTVRHVGDPVAVVIADTLSRAKDAAERVEVDYQPLPATADTRKGEVAFDVGLGESREKVELAFSKAKHVTRLELANNRLVANPMEPRAALAEYDPASGRTTLYTPSQGPHHLHGQIADAVLKIGRDKLRVVSGNVGGAFGMKIFLYPEQPLIATTWANMGAYLSNFGPFIPQLAAPMLSGVYRIPAIYLNIKGTLTNSVPVDAYRGAGRPEAIYLLERTIDLAARELGLAPDELRRRNMISSFPHQTPVESRYDSGDFAGVMDKALQNSQWKEFSRRREEAEKRGMLRGIGLAMYIERCGGGPGDTVRLKVDENEITLYSGMQDNGQGHVTTFIQLLSAKFGIDAGRIRVVQGDTDLVPAEGLTGGSRFLAIGGVAAQSAADEVIEKGRELASRKLEVSPSDIEYKDGEYRIAGTDRKISLLETAKASGGIEAFHTRTPQHYTYPNGCHICEVEIDPASGETKVVRYTVVDDFGRAVNPLLLEGQVHGGTAQGIGQALLEHAIYDAESAQLLTGSFMDYAMPRADTLPAFDCGFHHVPCATNPLGVKGAGEAGAVGAPAAVINAVVDALYRVNKTKHIDMPATSEKVWRALRGK